MSAARLQVDFDAKQEAIGQHAGLLAEARVYHLPGRVPKNLDQLLDKHALICGV